jgi:hypothetical protein
MATLSFSNIIGPPPQSVLDEASSDQTLIAEQEEVTQKRNNELAKLRAPLITDYRFPPSPAAPIPPLVATTVGKNCPEIIGLYTSKYPNVRLHPYYTDANKYLIQRARIRCSFPDPFQEVIIKREATYRIFYKTITKQSYKYYLLPAIRDDELENRPLLSLEELSKRRILPIPIDPSFLFGPNKGKSKYFNCFDVESAPGREGVQEDTEDEIINFYTFNLTATTVYRIYSDKSWIIDTNTSEIVINISEPTNSTIKQVLKQSFKDYSIVNNIFKTSIIPDKILKTYNNWKNQTFNYYGSNNEVFVNKKTGSPFWIISDTCFDDCGRSINISIYKEKNTETKNSLIRCNNNPPGDCKPNQLGKVVYGPLQPTIIFQLPPPT